jgi:hypothetical protein
MQIYYESLFALEQHTRQLDRVPCRHCSQTAQLVSHGFVYKKRVGADPEAVGKRVFCSNRKRRTGCGRTVRLYLEATLRRLHYAGAHMAAFVLALLAGATVRHAYGQATGAADPRHAWRWLNRLDAKLSDYRNLIHRPALDQTEGPPPARRRLRIRLLTATLHALRARFGPPLCAPYQRHTQRAFL